MEHSERFKQALIRMLQAGEFQKLIGCPEGRCAKMEFHMTRIFHIHLTRRFAVFHERDLEAIHRHTKGRWRRMRPSIFPRDRIVIDRASGALLPDRRLGQSTPQRHPILQAAAGGPGKHAVKRRAKNGDGLSRFAVDNRRGRG